jgi:hypothetical protein
VVGTGSATLSLAATYRTVWEVGIAYTHFVGSPRDQALADRDFVTLSISRTF